MSDAAHTTSPLDPPMETDTDEASAEQLEAARAQGRAYGDALALMTGKIA